MRAGDYVYSINDRAKPPKRMRLVRVLQNTAAGRQWLAAVEVDGKLTEVPVAEQALQRWPPPSAS